MEPVTVVYTYYKLFAKQILVKNIVLSIGADLIQDVFSTPPPRPLLMPP